MSGDHNMYQKTKSYLDDFECPRCGHCCLIEEEHTSREAMQMAIAALDSDPISHAGLVSRKQAITALRQALVDADNTSQKRVDEMVKTEHDRAVELGQAYERGWNAALAQREWVGLTDEEIEHIADSEWEEAFVRMIEAKLKEKNT